MKSKRLYILDDDPEILYALELVFEEHFKEVVTFDDPDKLKQRVKKSPPDILILDLNYSTGQTSGSEGMAVIESLRKQGFTFPIVVISAYGDIDKIVDCIKIGANDFIQKPWSNQRLWVTVENALKLHQKEKEVSLLKSENTYYRTELEENMGMVGSSNAMQLVRDKIAKVAASDANVLILGANGTGKELVARAIHQQSHRQQHPFIKIDLGTVHEQLFESELFGAKKGAYTGLDHDKTGRIELANRGSLFLDEIGNLSLPMQAKLLSVLQNREIIPVGSIQPVAIDVRLVCATNKLLPDLLDEKTFRQDLLYRINTVEIQMPALRERVQDIPELLEHFKQFYEQKYKKEALKWGSQLINKAQNYPWPGNVRELQHAVERAVLMCTQGVIGVDDLLTQRKTVSSASNQNQNFNLEEMEKNMISDALRFHSGNMTRTAKDLGLTRAALYRRLEKYEL